MTSEPVKTRKPPCWLFSRSIPSAVAFAAALVCFSMNPIGIDLRRGSNGSAALLWTGVLLDVLIIAGVWTTVVALKHHPQWIDPARGSRDRPHRWRAWVVATSLGFISLGLLIPVMVTGEANSYGAAQTLSALMAFGIFLYVANRESNRSIFK